MRRAGRHELTCRFQNALESQPQAGILAHPVVKALAAVLFAAGSTLVVSSMWALGVTGTYLGDYFGILMDHIVTGFPFNVCGDPMYWGSSANFVAVSLWYAKPAGLILSVLVIAVYYIALQYEGCVMLMGCTDASPFTMQIYKSAEERKNVEQSVQPASDGIATRTRSQARLRTKA